MPSPDRMEAAEALQRAVGTLSTTAMTRMDAQMPWFRELGAAERSWVGLIVQAGIRGFVGWYRSSSVDPAGADTALAASVFGAAPRALTGTITLQQTVDLVRLGIDVVEENIEHTVPEASVADVRGAVLRYAREVAFATAEVYARAAEARGAWDARLEALVVDSVLRADHDETVLSRASALGWNATSGVLIALGFLPSSRPERSDADLFDDVRRSAAQVRADALCAAQGDRLVVVLGSVTDAQAAGVAIADHFAPGPVVLGPLTPDLASAHLSARGAQAGFRAVSGWPDAPRPVHSDELLPERALAGDGHARRYLVDEVFVRLADEKATLVETLTTFFEVGDSIEAAARSLFVHPNTVRYRLRKATELTGLSPTNPRHAFAYRIALVLGRQSGRARHPDGIEQPEL
ncbi:MAG: helix-turn-helix domain-containing protein [Nocardioides sp.]